VANVLEAVRHMCLMRSASRTKTLGELLTAEQAASTLGVSVATLWRWRGQGLLRGKRALGRTVFDRSEVEAVLRRRRASAAG
jgi:predicted DNA-binding transcriptional regulator AlpA